MPDNSEFVKSTERVKEGILSIIANNMQEACLNVERTARQNCPKDLGILAASITSEVEQTSTEIVGRIGSNMEYAPYVHNGTGIYAKDGNGRKKPWGYEVKEGKYEGFHWTRGQKPQPFLENAKLSNKAVIERTLGKNI